MILKERLEKQSSGIIEQHRYDFTVSKEDIENALKAKESSGETMPQVLSGTRDDASALNTPPPLFRVGYLDDQVLDKVITDIDELPEIIEKISLPAEPISSQTLDYAKKFIVDFYNLLKFYDNQLKITHVTTEGEGEVSFEGWRGKKMLTFFMEPSGEVEY